MADNRTESEPAVARCHCESDGSITLAVFARLHGVLEKKERKEYRILRILSAPRAGRSAWLVDRRGSRSSVGALLAFMVSVDATYPATLRGGHLTSHLLGAVSSIHHPDSRQRPQELHRAA